VNGEITFGLQKMSRDNLEDLSVDGRIILKCILKNSVGAWAGLIWLRIGTGGGCL
jgi:hypothetical protein